MNQQINSFFTLTLTFTLVIALSGCLSHVRSGPSGSTYDLETSADQARHFKTAEACADGLERAQTREQVTHGRCVSRPDGYALEIFSAPADSGYYGGPFLNAAPADSGYYGGEASMRELQLQAAESRTQSVPFNLVPAPRQGVVIEEGRDGKASREAELKEELQKAKKRAKEERERKLEILRKIRESAESEE